MIVRPPGLPMTMKSLPSFATIVGVMLESMRLPGRDEVRLRADEPLSVSSAPGPALKSPISLFSRKPAPGTTIFEPYPSSSV